MGEDTTKIYPSKIKKIAIELKDYFFFHSPYLPGNQARRFIGRTRQMQQLRTMLQQTKSISGTYLVTGYRGSGKTSFVNIVLAEIGESGYLSGRGWQLLRIWGTLLFIGLIYNYLAPIWFLYLFPVLLLPFTWLLFSRWYMAIPAPDKAQQRGFVKSKNPRRSVRQTLHMMFFISSAGDLEHTLFNLLQGFFIIALILIFIFLISFCWNLYDKNVPFYHIPIPQFHFWSTACIFCYWFALKFSSLKAAPQKEKRIDEKGFWKSLKKNKSTFYQWLKRRLRSLFKPKLVIRLNLNYSNLKEREILQLIAHTLYERYTKWRRTPFQLLLRGSQIFILWLLVAVPYQTINKSGTSLDHLKHSLNRHFNQLIQADEDEQNPVTQGKKAAEKSVFLPALIYQDLNMIYQKSRTFVRHYVGFVLDLVNVIPRHRLVKWSYYIFPQNFEIILFFIFGFVVLLYRMVLNRQWLYIPGHSRILFLLRELNERMAAAVTVNSGSEVNLSRGFGKWFHKRSLAYPLADERTIEQGILRVLEEMVNFPIILGRPVFFFVFDELDKITVPAEPPQTVHTAPQFVSSFENMRRRQQQIEKVLSNLKQLLTTAPAKFIFIAGRELYDTCLADFTGRTFLHSSIFNQTFYIDSFLSDHSDTEDHRLTSLTESYICQFLMPQNERDWRKTWPKLTDYAKYLDTRFEIDETLKKKALWLLEDFVFYCTYRGSGSPKKITQLLEGFVQMLPQNTCDSEWLIIGENPQNRYLVFNFPQQFEICNTSRLLQPISQTLEHVSERLNDKLTTSILMVLDYLFKFHKSAFRLDCLEWMPEMLYINRDPDLRQLIYDILQLIENKYLEPIHNGLFDFRFSNRIRGEIYFSSRISKLESAVFNFSLDESREAERFMLRQLREQLELLQLNNGQNGASPNLTACRLYEKLGDLHMFNENYDQTLTEYFNAIRLLKTSRQTKGGPDDENFGQL